MAEGTPQAPATPAAAPAPLAIPQQAPNQTRHTKTFGTKPKLPPAPAVVAAPAPAPTAAPAPAAKAEAPAAKVEAPPAPAAAPTPEVAKTLTPGEEARRLAAITRVEGKVSAEKQALARERDAIAREKLENREGLRRAALVEQLRHTPQGQKLARIQQITGWSPSELMEEVIGTTTRTPEQVAAERNQTQEQKTAELTRQVQEWEKRDQANRQQAQVKDYIQSAIVPVVTPKDFPFLCNELGDKLPGQMYAAMNEEWKKTGVAPDPRKLAARAEAWYRQDAEKKAELLGLSVTAPQIANPVAQGGTASSPTTQSTSQALTRNRFQSPPTFRAKHRAG